MVVHLKALFPMNRELVISQQFQEKNSKFCTLWCCFLHRVQAKESRAPRHDVWYFRSCLLFPANTCG